MSPSGTAVVLLAAFNKMAEVRPRPRCLTLRRGETLAVGLGRPSELQPSDPRVELLSFRTLPVCLPPPDPGELGSGSGADTGIRVTPMS
jgi:hypothetical protein